MNLTDKLVERLAQTRNFVIARNRNPLGKITVSFGNTTHGVTQLGERHFNTVTDQANNDGH